MSMEKRKLHPFRTKFTIDAGLRPASIFFSRERTRREHSRLSKGIKEIMRDRTPTAYEPKPPLKYDSQSISFKNSRDHFLSEGRTFKVLGLLAEKQSADVQQNLDDMLPSAQL